MVVVDSVSRYIQGVLSQDSGKEESFALGLLEYPQYTRPEIFLSKAVPEILVSGHHKNIEIWRRREALKNTFIKRPELLKKIKLSEEEKQYVQEIKSKLKNFKKDENSNGHYKVN
jgi:tRNA (guanine37-N1)-methyltransferase